MTRLILVRHAEAEGNLNRKFHGWTDSNLTEKGLKQAQALSIRLASENFDLIYSSDLKRAYSTAKFIADVKKLEIKIVNELREINGGEWEGKDFDQLKELWPEQAYNLNNQLNLLSLPKGESVIDLYKRIVNAVNNIITHNPEKNICIVTHGTVIKLLLCYFYSRPLEQIETIMWGDNTSVSIIEVNEDKYIVLSESDNSHLSEEISTFASQTWWRKENK